MAGKKRIRLCKYGCGAELNGYQAERYHYLPGKCPKRPPDAPAEDLKEADQAIIDAGREFQPPEPPAPSIPLTVSGDNPITDPNGPAVTLPPAGIPVEAVNPIEQKPPAASPDKTEISQVVHKASQFDDRLARLEREISILPKVVENLSAEIQKIPAYVEKCVMDLIQAQTGGSAGAETGTGNPPADVNPGQPVRSNIAGNLFGGTFGSLLQNLDVMSIIGALAKKQPPEGIIENMIFNWITKSTAKKPAQPLDTSGKGMMFFSRGVGQATASLKMKNVDPTSMAVAITTQADEMLKERLTPADTLYWKGRKSAADAFLASQLLAKQQIIPPATLSGPASGAVPPVPPAPPPPARKRVKRELSEN